MPAVICSACRASCTALPRSSAYIGGDAEGRQGQRLPGRVANLLGHGQGAAAIVGRLGDPAQVRNVTDRPARQSAITRDGPRSPIASRTAVKWPSAPARSAENSAAAPSQTCAAHHPSLPTAARAGRLAQQRVLARQPAPQQPPRRQRDRQPQRDGHIMVHGPGQHLPHGGVFGVQPAGGGQLSGAGLQARLGLLGDLQRVSGQGGGRRLLLPGLGQQPGPVGAQRLQHHIPGPAIRTGPRRDQQRAVHQVQHRRPGASPRDRLGGL